MQPEAVRSRYDLLEYLSQSARSSYLETEGSDLRQLSTFLKSYIVERHLHDDGSEPEWPRVFVGQDKLPDSITLLATKGSLAFFSERINRRFCMIHTIAKSSSADAVMSRLTRGINSLTDRAWMPSSFVLDARSGRLVGYKLASDSVRIAETATDSQEGFDSNDGYNDGMLDDERDDTQKGFRMASSSPLYAIEDLTAILSSQIYADRRSIDWMATQSRLNDLDSIHSRIYSNGKVISKTPTPESHVSEVRRITESYGTVVEEIESNYAIRWAAGKSGVGRLGEPILLEFRDYELPDLEYFAEAVFSGNSDFGLLGIPTHRNLWRIDVEAIDLHRGDVVSFEITNS